MSLNTPKRIQRINRIFELRCMGWTMNQIQKGLREEHFIRGTSTKQIRRDLRSPQMKAYVDELIRLQMKEIYDCTDVKTRLEYRDRILNKLVPSRRITKTQRLTDKGLKIGKQPIKLIAWDITKQDSRKISTNSGEAKTVPQ